MAEQRPAWDVPQIAEVAEITKSYQWLEKAGLTDSTEALILAAQEQALGTRWIEAGVYHTRTGTSALSMDSTLPSPGGKLFRR